MEIEVDTSQADRAIQVLQRLPKEMNAGILGALRVSAKAVAARTRVLLRRKSGRSSLPGEPPAKQTGTLAGSIRFKRVRSRSFGPQLAYIVFNTQGTAAKKDSFYARFLELGTGGRPAGGGRNKRGRQLLGSKRRKVMYTGREIGGVAPRPFLTRAREELRGEELARLQKAIEQTLQEAAAR